MLLKELIAYLEQKDASVVLSHGFFHPHSWRGDYAELAFEPKANVSVGDMLESARSALGATYEGYKGGSYTMGEYSEVYLAEYGNTGEPLSELTLDAAFVLDSYKELVSALQALLAEPYGCSLCDSGKPCNPAKGHQPDCPYEQARAALMKAGIL